ncbi:MAG: hypothetical protein DYG96_01335 [Chlorobi bacterium CHB2]|nr:hypothetical protein [Chlorobi bacterium CHB2]
MRYLLIVIGAIALLAAGVVIYEAATGDRTISRLLFGAGTEPVPVADLPSDSRHFSFRAAAGSVVAVQFEQAEIRVLRGVTASIGVDLFVEGDAVGFGRVRTDATQDSGGNVHVAAYPVGSPLTAGSITILITLPDSTTLDAKGKAGRLTVDGIVGEVRFATERCATTVRDLRGTVAGTDTSGTITLERLTGNGSFALAGSALHAAMNDGNLRGVGEGEVQIEEHFGMVDIQLRRGNIAAALRQITDTCRLLTQAGSIEIRLPGALLPSLDALPRAIGIPDSLPLPVAPPIVARAPQGAISVR